MRNLLTYGLYGNELIHVSNVDNGLACNCICPACKASLIARNNSANKKIAHFAHHSVKNCDKGYETALHLLAKEVLLETKRLKLPAYHYDYDPTNEKSIFAKSREYGFDSIILEERVKTGNVSIVPDAIGINKDKELYIEFAKSHFIDYEKREKIRVLGIACIEIDLAEQILDKDALINFFNSITSSIYWICNPLLDKKYHDDQERKRQEKEVLQKKHEQESLTKLQLYQNHRFHHLFTVQDGEIRDCPKKQEAFNKLKTTTRFYTHNILKRIIDGEPWQGKTYGRNPKGKWIYLNGEEVVVFPPDHEFRFLTDVQKKGCRLFYAGLEKIKEILEDNTIGDCINCNSAGESFTTCNIDYQVCKHP